MYILKLHTVFTWITPIKITKPNTYTGKLIDSIVVTLRFSNALEKLRKFHSVNKQNNSSQCCRSVLGSSLWAHGQQNNLPSV